MNETTIAEESGKTHDYYTQEYGIPGNKKGRKSTQQRTRIDAHANMEDIIIAHTKASIEGIPPKHIKNRHNMETNEQTDHKNTRNTTQDRKSENKKRSEARRILTLQYE